LNNSLAQSTGEVWSCKVARKYGSPGIYARQRSTHIPAAAKKGYSGSGVKRNFWLRAMCACTD